MNVCVVYVMHDLIFLQLFQLNCIVPSFNFDNFYFCFGCFSENTRTHYVRLQICKSVIQMVGTPESNWKIYYEGKTTFEVTQISNLNENVKLIIVLTLNFTAVYKGCGQVFQDIRQPGK
jgi:hypothetical protein